MRLVLGVVAATLALGALYLQPGQETSLATYATRLEHRTSSQAHNAELSMAKLNGAVVGSGETFSFNGRIGTYSRDAGYRKAPVSYNGQLISSWGGGVCQTSTTLYNAALLSGMDILERHRHRFAPGYVPPGLDAAVAYPDLDLKFRNPHPFPVRIEANLSGTSLMVSIMGEGRLEDKPEIVTRVSQVKAPEEFVIGQGDRGSRVRNTGKSGFQVAVYRTIGNRRDLVSSDEYPVMHRVIERR
jgi:vancomycin resistance protein VanW